VCAVERTADRLIGECFPRKRIGQIDSLLRDQEAVGSNPIAPTTLLEPIITDTHIVADRLVSGREVCKSPSPRYSSFSRRLTFRLRVCPFSKRDPHEFIGWFRTPDDRLPSWRCRQAERSRSREADPGPVPRCFWNRSRCAIKSPYWSAAELVGPASVALIACFGSCCRAGVGLVQ
jgi:hypothetical protein